MDVLICDDEETIRGSLVEKLCEYGHDTQSVTSGQEALEFIRRKSNDVDVIILDYKMPDMDGMETFEQLKPYGIPVIFATSYGSISLATEFLKAGGFDFIEKPFDWNILNAKILNVHRARMESFNIDLRSKMHHLYQKDIPGITLNSAEQVYNEMQFVGALDREMAYVLHLNERNQLIEREPIAMGILNNVLLHAREVFKNAIVNHASRVILVHNHPSGDPSPSPEDMLMTEELQKAGQIVGIPLVDHIIIARDRYFSISKDKWTFDSDNEFLYVRNNRYSAMLPKKHVGMFLPRLRKPHIINKLLQV